MSVLSIRDVGDDIKEQLKSEAQASGASLSELARTLIAEGLDRRRRAREQEQWIAETEAARAFEAERIEKYGMLLDTDRAAFPGEHE